jgi:copper(I)-binding protein
MQTCRNGWVAFAAVVLALLASDHAGAADYSIGSLRISDPWTRATPKGAPVAGGYMTITNTGTSPDRLIGGTAAVAGRFELHSMVMEKGVAKMRQVAGGVEIKPGQTIELKPGSMHVMMMELKQSFKPGETVKGTLEFENAGKVEIEYAVKPLGATSPAGGGHGKH